MKKKIQVPVVWQMCGSYYIEVDKNATQEEMVKAAEEYVFDMATPLPVDQYYLDDSMVIDDESPMYLEEPI